MKKERLNNLKRGRNIQNRKMRIVEYREEKKREIVSKAKNL